MADILVSIHPRFVAGILEGTKQVEIRKRRLRVGSGARLWIYCTRPVARVVALAIVESSSEGEPEEVWQEIEHHSGMSQCEYRSYVNGSRRITAIRLRNPRQLRTALDLETIRSAVGSFQPPQFAKRLAKGGQLLRLLEQAAGGECG